MWNCCRPGEPERGGCGGKGAGEADLGEYRGGVGGLEGYGDCDGGDEGGVGRAGLEGRSRSWGSGVKEAC